MGDMMTRSKERIKREIEIIKKKLATKTPSNESSKGCFKDWINFNTALLKKLELELKESGGEQ